MQLYQVKYENRNVTAGKWTLVKQRNTTNKYCVLGKLNVCMEYRVYVQAFTIGFGPYGAPVYKIIGGKPEGNPFYYCIFL